MIKGLSETRRLPRLGRLRLGIRVKKKNLDSRCNHKPEEMCRYCTIPRETQHFVVPVEVSRVYGEKPMELDVYLPIDDIEKVFQQRLNFYTASRLRCAGDGEKALRIFKDVPAAMKKDYPEDTEDLDLVDFPCPCPLLESGECRRNGTLNVILPKVSLGGIYSVSTGSVHSIIEINSDIDFVRALLGRASMIPLKLKRVEQKIQYKDQPAKSHWILKLEFQGSVDDVNKIMETKKLIPPIQFALPPPDRVEPGEIYDAEIREDAEPNPPGAKPTSGIGPGESAENARDAVFAAGRAPTRDRLDAGEGSRAGSQPSPAGQQKAMHEAPDPHGGNAGASLPHTVSEILSELQGAEPTQIDKVVNKHFHVIKQMAMKYQILLGKAADERKKGGKGDAMSPSVEKREKLIREIYLFTTKEQCDALERNKKAHEGLETADLLKVSQVLQVRRKEIEGQKVEEGRLI